MSKSKTKAVVESGEVLTQSVSVENVAIESFDENIRSSRGGKTLSPAVQAVFDKMQTAVEFAQSNDGKAQIVFPHNEFPLRNKLPNAAIANALLSGKKRFTNIQFSIVIDAVNREGARLNASVLRVMVKPTEEV